MSFLAETFSTQLAREGFLPGVSPHVDIDTVLVFESLVADVAVVQQPRLLLGLLLGAPVVLPGHLGEVRQLGGGGGGGGGGGSGGGGVGGRGRRYVAAFATFAAFAAFAVGSLAAAIAA